MGKPVRSLAGISGQEAAELLGVTRAHVYRLAAQGKLGKSRRRGRRNFDHGEVEELALARWYPGHPYWVTTAEAAQILGVCPQRVRQLVERGFVPAVRHRRHLLFRRPQLMVVANARHRSGDRPRVAVSCGS